MSESASSGKTLVVAGLGLLGGSLALAARKRRLFDRIVAVGRRDLSAAVTAGMIDSWTTDLATASAEADTVVLCTPVDRILEQLDTVLEHARPGTLVTDVGSTKERLVRRAREIPTAARFIGSHPMVGGHLTGWENAREDLFGKGITYVTATHGCDTDTAAEIGAMWAALGARVVYIHPRRHDYLCALLSHVPHMAAVALVESIRGAREDVNQVRVLAGNGLRDTTRIAMGSADMWSEICRHNGENIAGMLDNLGDRIHRLAEMVRSGDESFHEELQEIAAYRRGM